MPEVILNGPEGRIEGNYYRSDNKYAPVVLILHPHPLHGGTMNNKVVHNLAQSFYKVGFTVLRINFRGVGKSQGQFDNGIGELADSATALDWLQNQNMHASSFWIGGFSFGSWIALQLLMRRPELQGFIAISPPVDKYDFSFLSPCPTQGLIIQGDQDSIVSAESVGVFAQKINRQCSSKVEYSLINGADHFFREKIIEMVEVIDNYFKLNLNDNSIKKSKLDRRRRQTMDEPLL